MQPFRASLTDDAGQVIAEIEGSIQSSEEAEEARQGRFEFQETGEFMQGVLEGKPFRLVVDDGSQLVIKVHSAEASSNPGQTEVEFSTA